MRLIPEIRVPVANIGSRVANTGASFATGDSAHHVDCI